MSDQTSATSETARANPYRHDHNPLNADFTGGFCSACEWEIDLIRGARSYRRRTLALFARNACVGALWAIVHPAQPGSAIGTVLTCLALWAHEERNRD